MSQHSARTSTKDPAKVGPENMATFIWATVLAAQLEFKISPEKFSDSNHSTTLQTSQSHLKNQRFDPFCNLTVLLKTEIDLQFHAHVLPNECWSNDVDVIIPYYNHILHVYIHLILYDHHIIIWVFSYETSFRVPFFGEMFFFFWGHSGLLLHHGLSLIWTAPGPLKWKVASYMSLLIVLNLGFFSWNGHRPNLGGWLCGCVYGCLVFVVFFLPKNDERWWCLNYISPPFFGEWIDPNWLHIVSTCKCSKCVQLDWNHQLLGILKVFNLNCWVSKHQLCPQPCWIFGPLTVCDTWTWASGKGYVCWKYLEIIIFGVVC